MSFALTPLKFPVLDRKFFIVALVLLLHAAALWALQAGLLRRVVEVFVPVVLAPTAVEPPKLQTTPMPPPAPEPQKPLARQPQPAVPPAPMPLAVPDAPPAPNAPTGVVAPPAPLPPVAAPVAVAAPPAPPAPPRIELPISDAAYLNNPKPAYPRMSMQQGEQGRVVLNVVIGADGNPKKVEIHQSSGFERLDRAAMVAVMRWRVVPGKRGGVPETMPMLVPLNFSMG